MSRAASLLCATVLVTGCSLETLGLGDEATPDGAAGETDAAPGLDATVPDRDGRAPPPPTDARTPMDDARTPPMEDARVGDPDAGPPPPMGCADRYGGAPSFMLCAERATECEFYTYLNYTHCADVCDDFGGECVRTYREDEVSVCTYMTGFSSPRPCESTHEDEICVCTRP